MTNLERAYWESHDDWFPPSAEMEAHMLTTLTDDETRDFEGELKEVTDRVGFIRPCHLCGAPVELPESTPKIVTCWVCGLGPYIPKDVS